MLLNTIENYKENVCNKIQNYCNKKPVLIEFDQRDYLSKEQISTILENGIEDFYEELFNCNHSYIYETEKYFIENELIIEFENDLIQILNILSFFSNEEIILDDESMINFIEENEIYPNIDIDIDHFLNQNIIALFKFHSNFDCCNSMDVFKKDNYLYEIYKTVNKGIRKKDYLSEFNNVYGASLFVIPFSISIKDYLQLEKDFKESKKITIPKNTTFGFFSSFLGSGSQFQNCTYKKMTIDINYGNSNYDYISLISDFDQSYNLNDVYGFTDQDFSEINFKLN